MNWRYFNMHLGLPKILSLVYFTFSGSFMSSSISGLPKILFLRNFSPIFWVSMNNSISGHFINFNDTLYVLHKCILYSLWSDLLCSKICPKNPDLSMLIIWWIFPSLLEVINISIHIFVKYKILGPYSPTYFVKTYMYMFCCICFNI